MSYATRRNDSKKFTPVVESRTETVVINNNILEEIKNDDPDNFVVSRDIKREYNGAVYKVESNLLPLPIDVTNMDEIDYIADNIITESNNLLSSYTNADFKNIRLLIIQNSQVKSIVLNKNDIRNNNKENLINNITNTMTRYASEYGEGDGSDTSLFRLTLATVFQNRRGGCNEHSKDLNHYHSFSNIHTLIGMGKYENCTFDYKIHNFKSKNNNCGLVCLIKGCGLNGNKV